MSGTVSALLVLAYVLPVALLALLLTRAQARPRRLLVGVLIMLPLFYTGHFLLLQAVQGWPSHARLPERFRLLAFDISEPDPKHRRAGEILLWVLAEGMTEPRAHRLDYDKAMHQALVDAGRRQAQGRPQIGVRRDTGRTNPSLAEARRPRFEFQDEEPVALPEKGNL